VTLNGKMVSLGVRGEENKAQAFAAWARQLAGQSPAPPTPAVAHPVQTARTIRAVVDGYLADIGPRVKPLTLITYRRYLDPFATSHGGLAVSSVDADLLHRHVARPNWSSTYRANALLVINQALRWAGLRLTGLRVPRRRSRGAEAVIDPETFDRVLDEFDRDFAEYLTFLWETGCRPSEGMGLVASDVNLAAGVARLTDHKTAHHGHERLVYLSDRAVEILRPRVARYPSGPLFRNADGNPLNRNAVVNRFDRLNKRLGTRITAYQIRHSFCCRLLSAGTPDAHVAALMGHTGTNMIARVYGHMNAQARLLRETLNRNRTPEGG
jgi:integrase